MTTKHMFRFALLTVLCGLFALTAGAASCSFSIGSSDDDGSGTPDTIIKSVTLTKSTSGDTYAPGPATTVFSTNDVVYAVVAIKNAPKGTRFNARWTVVDVGSAAKPGQEIDVAEVTADGTRNLEFDLSNKTSGFPVGKYQVEISVDGQVEKTVGWSVQ